MEDNKKRNEYMKEWRAKNADEFRAYQRAWKKKWRSENKEKYNAYQRELYKKRMAKKNEVE